MVNKEVKATTVVVGIVANAAVSSRENGANRPDLASINKNEVVLLADLAQEALRSEVEEDSKAVVIVEDAVAISLQDPWFWCRMLDLVIK